MWKGEWFIWVMKGHGGRLIGTAEAPLIPDGIAASQRKGQEGHFLPRQADKFGTIPERVVAPSVCPPGARSHIRTCQGDKLRDAEASGIADLDQQAIEAIAGRAHR